jgi:hypothetical protein
MACSAGDSPQRRSGAWGVITNATFDETPDGLGEDRPTFWPLLDYNLRPEVHLAIRLSRAELLRLARLGAHARLAELDRERDAIERLFRQGPTERRLSTVRPATAMASEHSGRRRRMSAAARKAISERMTKYWAARRSGRKK